MRALAGEDPHCASCARSHHMHAGLGVRTQSAIAAILGPILCELENDGCCSRPGPMGDVLEWRYILYIRYTLHRYTGTTNTQFPGPRLLCLATALSVRSCFGRQLGRNYSNASEGLHRAFHEQS